jgi:hypothetical protein
MEWQKRLYDHEQAPPPDLWPALSDRLQKGPGTLAGRFADLEAAPPDDAWPAISQSIRDMDRKGNGILRRLAGWAVPAAAAGLAFLSVRILSPASPTVGTPAATALSRVSVPQKSQAPSPSDTDRKVGRAASVTQVRQGLPASGGPSIPAKTRPIDVSRDRNYMEVCDSSRIVCNRINYKLESMARYIHAKGTMEGADPCNREFREWVDRMEHSAYIPAPGHFFDIVELAASLHGDR